MRAANTMCSGAAAALLLAAAAPAPAQDIEARAAMMGRTLPQAYYDRIARDPRAFEFPDAVTHRARRAQSSRRPAKDDSATRSRARKKS